MDKTKNKLYTFLFIACISGNIWLILNLLNSKNEKLNLNVCYFKSITSIPCPSCGSTRSILSILNGNFKDSILINPLGWIILLIMIISPIWIIIDLITKNNSLFRFYKLLELKIKKPIIYIPLIVLILLNWFWNINKQL